MEELITSAREINSIIKKQVEIGKKVKIGGLSNQSCVAVGITKSAGKFAEINVEGNAGDFFASLNNGAKIVLNGNAKRFVGDGMISGEIIVNGNVESCGEYMNGGIIIINGNCGNVGHYNKNGFIIINGNAKDVGKAMQNGTVIVNGNAEKIGEGIVSGNVFVSGNFELGKGAKVSFLSEQDKNMLTINFLRFKINAKAENFRKITTG